MLIHVRVGWVGKANCKIIYLPTPPLEAYARHQPQGRSLQFEEICIVIERKDVWLGNVLWSSFAEMLHMTVDFTSRDVLETHWSPYLFIQKDEYLCGLENWVAFNLTVLKCQNMSREQAVCPLELTNTWMASTVVRTLNILQLLSNLDHDLKMESEWL